MTRALSSTCLVLLALLGLGSADAFAKPKIAVLGLEVLNPAGGALDPATGVAAKDITEALRGKARSPNGKYELASNSDKELVDEKLVNTCDTELPSCMAPIGSQIGAARLLYGRIRKQGQDFIVDLVLLNVDTRVRDKYVNNAHLPVADALDPVKVGNFAKKQYAYLTDETNTATLIVEITNKEYNPDIHRGTVYIDGDMKGNLSSGRLPIPGLSDGKHKLEIKSLGGFQKFETSVTVNASEPRTVFPVTLTPNVGGVDDGHTYGGTIDQGPHTNYWRPMFVTGSIAALAGASLWIYAYSKELDAEGRITSKIDTGTFDMSMPPKPIYRDADPADCGKDPNLVFPASTDPSGASKSALKDACKYKDWTKYGITAASIGGVIMLGTFYMAWLRNGDVEQPRQDSKSGSRTRKPSFAVTPIITPGGGGATLQIDW